MVDVQDVTKRADAIGARIIARRQEAKARAEVQKARREERDKRLRAMERERRREEKRKKEERRKQRASDERIIARAERERMEAKRAEERRVRAALAGEYRGNAASREIDREVRRIERAERDRREREERDAAAGEIRAKRLREQEQRKEQQQRRRAKRAWVIGGEPSPRFMSHVRRIEDVGSEEGCWTWTGPSLVYIGGVGMTPMRLMFELTHGPVCGGKIVHTCGRARCVRPSHLRLSGIVGLGFRERCERRQERDAG